ncbi:DUF5667 domain-containing protein [Chloroflexota bacterium]
MITRGEDIEQCLRDYPDVAEELEPLLQTALATRAKVNMIQPRADFKALAKQRMLTQVRANVQKQNKPARFSLIGWQQRWAVVVASVFFMILVGGGGIVAAAGNSMPDDFLYPVKIATEHVRLAFTSSDLGKAKLETEFADRRINEIAEMANEGKVAAVEATAERLVNHLTETEKLTEAQKAKDVVKEEDVAELRGKLAQYAEEYPTVLEEALEKVPLESKATISQVLDTSKASIVASIQNINIATRVEEETKPIQTVRMKTVMGIIRAITNRQWVVNEDVVNIDADTVVEGVAKVGLTVEVVAQVQADGSLLAKSIAITSDVKNDAGVQPEVSPKPAPTDTLPRVSPRPVPTDTSPEPAASPAPVPTDTLPRVSPTPVPTDTSAEPTASPTPVPTDTSDKPTVSPTPVPTDTLQKVSPTPAVNDTDVNLKISPTPTPTDIDAGSKILSVPSSNETDLQL